MRKVCVIILAIMLSIFLACCDDVPPKSPIVDTNSSNEAVGEIDYSGSDGQETSHGEITDNSPWGMGRVPLN